jgi:hypothetical protein
MGRFSITTWPEGIIRIPGNYASALLCPWSDAELEVLPDGIEGLIAHPWHDISSDATVPSELYLRELRALDLDDPPQITDFVRSFGAMGLRYSSRSQVPFLHDLLAMPWLSADGSASVAELSLFWGVDVDELQRVQGDDEAFRSALTARGEHVLVGGRPSGESLAAFRLAAAWLRDLTSLALALRANDLQDGATRLAWESRWIQRPESMDDACQLLTQGLEALLRPFAPRVRIVREPSFDELDEAGLIETDGEGLVLPDGGRRERALEVHRLVPFETVPLVSTLAMQLFNHIAENAMYRTCAMETCGARFVTQRGRALQGQHKREGNVLYCSDLCARAQASRNYRARQRRERAEGGGRA